MPASATSENPPNPAMQPGKPRSYLYFRHTLPVRILHWINVLSLTVLLMSGLMIFNAHPSLDWGKSSYTGTPSFFEITSGTDAKGQPMGITRLWGHQFNTTGVLGISTDAEGDVLLTGYFESPSISFGTTTLTNAGAADIFVLKLGSATGLAENFMENTISVYPNPITTQTTFSLNNEVKNASLKVYDVNGKEAKQLIFSGKQVVLERGNLESGIYFYQINSENKNIATGKIIINN